MDRRIRVKCPECAASIELRVDQEELLDVKCPRCHNLFTAIVPPLVVEVEPVEVFDEVEVIEETPPVRQTRVVEPTARPTPTQRPKRVRQVIQSGSESTYANPTWQAPVPNYQAAPRVSGATHLKAMLIAGGSILGLGVLVMIGFMIKSAVSSLDWSGGSETTSSTQLASTSAETTTTSPASFASEPVAPQPVVSESTSSTPPATSKQLASPLVTSTTSTENPMSSGPMASSPMATLPATADPSSATTPAAVPKPASVDVSEKVIVLAEQMAQATKDGETDFIIDRTHPKLIELAGGRGKMLEILNKAMEPMRAQGIKIADYKILREVQVRRAGKDIYVVVPTIMDLNYQGRIMRTDSFLLGVSEDSGRTFSFLDGSGAAKNRSMLKRLLPNLPDDFAIPTPSLPREVSQ